MLKAAAAGACALALGFTSFASISGARAEIPADPNVGASVSTPRSGPVLKEAHISRLKSVLNLTAEQRVLWAPVEAALRDIARQSRDEASAGGVVQRISSRATAIAGDAMRFRKLASVARPLIAALDDSQKREAMTLVRAFGFDRMMTTF